MISDVLSEASDQIEDHLEPPTVYDDCRTEIDAVLASMGALRRMLDAPDGPSPAVAHALRDLVAWRRKHDGDLL